MKRISAAALFIMVPALILAYSAGPPNGKTGAPGEGTCHDCHASFGLNSGPGVLTIAAPDAFEAGTSYPIIVAIEQTGQTRWGFEFTPLTIGTCALIEPTAVQIETEGGKTYVKQTSIGTYAGASGQAAWTFTWTAPAQPPDVVTFYAAANAANGNNANSGDYVYTASLQIPLAQRGDDAAPLPANTLLFSSPNPVRDRALIMYRVPESSQVNLGIYDLAGSLVTSLVDEARPAGTWAVRWDSRDASGASVPGGVYLCRLVLAEKAETRTIVIVR
jgi:hypothetical protein